MAKRRKGHYFTMTVHHHGFIWWLLVDWWWRPIQYILWGLLCGITGSGLKKRTIR
nr:MAG TPA: hypothetical protein [Caudoviricetes sp.]